MKIIEGIKSLTNNLSTFEKLFYVSSILFLIILSFVFNDSKIALFNALCGVSYTFFAGKGKVFCFYVGILGTLCYCYIAFKNGFYANFFLYLLYYFPMQLLGIFKWKKNIQKNKDEIIKTSLKRKHIVFNFVFCIFCRIIIYFI